MTKSQIFVSFINLEDNPRMNLQVPPCELWPFFLFSFSPVEFDANVLKILVSSFP